MQQIPHLLLPPQHTGCFQNLPAAAEASCLIGEASASPISPGESLTCILDTEYEIPREESKCNN
jgi:hypothetical protein